MTNEEIDSFVSAKNNYEAALHRGTGISVSKERLKNVMFNCYPDLISMARGERANIAALAKDEDLKQMRKQVEQLQRDLESLNQSLEDSDAENDELRKQVKELEAQLANNKTPAKRTRAAKAVDPDAKE